MLPPLPAAAVEQQQCICLHLQTQPLHLHSSTLLLQAPTLI
jgi:hypothetical protein